MELDPEFKPDALFLGYLLWFAGLADRRNKDNLDDFERAKAMWLQDAEWKRGSGRTDFMPKPVPAFRLEPMGSVADSPDHSKLGIHFTSEYVADPNFDLPAPPPPPPLGVIEVGISVGGGMWSIGRNDTAPSGATATAPNGHPVKKVVIPFVFGKGGMTAYYQEV